MPRMRRILQAISLLTVIVVVAGVCLLWNRGVEAWWLHQLSSSEPVERSVALRRLVDMKSLRALPEFASIVAPHVGDLGSLEFDSDDEPNVGLAREALRGLLRMGPEALGRFFRECAPEARDAVAHLISGEVRAQLPVYFGSSDASVRFWALYCLRGRRDFDTILEVAQALSDPNERVRNAAACLLFGRQPGDPRTREGVRRALRSHDTTLLLWALDVANPGVALPAIVAALEHSDARVRYQAIRVLSRSDFDAAVDGLIRALHDPVEDVQNRAVNSLSRLFLPRGDASWARIASAVTQKLPHSSRLVRIGCVLTLGRVGVKVEGTIPLLLKEFRQRSATPQTEAAVALCRLRAVEAIPEIVDLLNRRVIDTSDVIWSLSHFGKRAAAAVPFLLERLNDSNENAWIRESCAGALGAIWPENETVGRDLIDIASDTRVDRPLRVEAIRALGAMENRRAEILPDLLRWFDEASRVDPEDFHAPVLSIHSLSTPNDLLSTAAVRSLAKLGTTTNGAIPAIRKAIEDEKVWYPAGAEALWKIDQSFIPFAIESFNRHLKSTMLLFGVPNLLAELGPRASAAVPSLVNLLGNYHKGDVATVVLERIGRPAVGALTECLESSDVILRARAARVLGRIGPAAESAAAALRRRTDDPDEEVRREASRALRRVTVLRDARTPPDPAPPSLPSLSPLVSLPNAASEAQQAAWETRRAEVLSRWKSFLGELPTERGHLDSQEVSREELPLFTRTLVRYRIEEGVTTDAYLLVPKFIDPPAEGTLPAVVVFHQTIGTHAKQAAGVDQIEPSLMIGVQLAELGYVVLCPRSYIFADDPETQDEDDFFRSVGVETYANNTRKVLARHPEWKGMTRMLLDAQRAVDYLESLTIVDSGRIGAIGHSLGAKQVLYAAAFDERIQAAVFSEGGIGLEFSNWEAEWYLGPSIRKPGFDLQHHENLALIAPRGFLLLAGGGADDARSWSHIEAALPVYEIFGARERIGWLHHEGGHRYPGVARSAAEEFLARQLADPVNQEDP